MNLEAALALPAGIELDLLVHRWLFEQKAGHHGIDFVPPPFSTDIAAAWTIVEKLVRSGKVVIVKGDGLRTGDFVPAWTVLCDNTERTDGATAPLAICRAALKAVWKD